MKSKPIFVSSLVLAIILGLGVGCTSKPEDGKISSDIQGKFSQDSGLSSKQLNVQAADGVVTLSGNVDNDAQREAAGRQAASVAGVKTVINNLQVATASVATPASAPASTKAAPLIAQPEAALPAEKAKPAAGKKARKTHNSDEPAKESSSAATSPTTTAENQAPADATPPAPPSPADSTSVAAAPPAPRKYIIDQGTQISVRLIDPIDSEKNQTGETFRATLNAPLTSDGEEAVPAGVELTGHLVDVKSAGKFAGQSVVVLQLDKLAAGGKTYDLQTDQYKKEAASRGKNTAEKVGGGALIGTIIGAIAGGGKGAAIGAAAGAGAGGGVQAASKSQQIKLPSETVLNFILQEPVTVERAPGPDANRQKLGDPQ